MSTVTPVTVTPAPVVPTPSTPPATNTLPNFSTKKLMGVVLVLALIGLGIAWIALSISGLPGWINIILIIVALLLVAVIGWLFFSE